MTFHVALPTIDCCRLSSSCRRCGTFLRFKAETRPSDRCQDSMFATGSMVLMASGLKNDAGDADATTRRLLINQGCDLIDNLSSGSGVDSSDHRAC